MTDTVTSVNSTSSASSTASTGASTASTSAPKLTPETKAKLQALGVDTTNITSEIQGQIALLQAQTQQKAAEQSASMGNPTEDVMMSEVKSLAGQLGVSVPEGAKVDEILSDVSTAISNLRASAGSDEAKLAQVENYEAQYASLSQNLTSMQASQNQLANSMSSMASYNKIYQNL